MGGKISPTRAKHAHFALKYVKNGKNGQVTSNNRPINIDAYKHRYAGMIRHRHRQIFTQTK